MRSPSVEAKLCHNFDTTEARAKESAIETGLLELLESVLRRIGESSDMGTEASILTEIDANIADEALRSLEELLQVRFTLWNREKEGVFRHPNSEAAEALADQAVAELCEAAMFESGPLVCESPEGNQLLAVAWPTRGTVPHFATCILPSDRVNLAKRLIELTLKEHRHSEMIDELREENGSFLRQLNEDMEELVFLRNMADKLTLESMTATPHDLVEYVLPNLGEAAGVEEIHFIDARGVSPKIIDSWILPGCENVVAPSVIERLAKNRGEEAQDLPLVSNLFDKTAEGEKYPGVREFALVAVATHNTTIGWLAAVNRHVDVARRHAHPVWRLGNNEIGTCEVSLISTAAAMLASYTHNSELLEERESLLLSVVRTLVSAIESRDRYTCGHSERVARYARRLAEEFGYDREGCRQMYLTGLLHDVGKIGLSDSVLKKAGPLTDEEFAEIKKHPDLGWAILRELEPMDYVLPGVLHHHERYDGKGYPDELKADETPLEGRLLAVVDAFDAMTSDRPYRKGMSWEKAVEVLLSGANSQWDAEIVNKFVEIMPDILNIQQNYRRPPLPTRKQELSLPSLAATADTEELDISEILESSE